MTSSYGLTCSRRWRRSATAILRVLPIYLHRNHGARDLYPEFHEPAAGAHGGHAMDMGPRPPSVHEVLAGTAPPSDQPQPTQTTARHATTQALT